MSSNKACRCTFCPAVFQNQVQRALHTLKMHYDSPPPPAESACSLEVIEPPERGDHRSKRSAARSPSLAPGIPDYSSLAKCDQCFAMFAHEDMLDNHKEAHHPATRAHRCSECCRSNTYRNAHERMAFRRRASTKRRLYGGACSAARTHRRAKCNVSHALRLVLRAHGINVPSMDVGGLGPADASFGVVGPFRCSDYFDDCARTFKSKKHLTKHHVRDHADAFEYNAVYYAARAHRCEHCPEAFTSVDAMIDHLYKVHNDDRRTILACASCSETFKSAANLANHAQTQHRRYDFDCDAHLTRHRASAHGITTEVKAEEGEQPKLEVTDEAMEEPRNGILLGMMMEEDAVKLDQKPELVAAASPKAIQCKFCSQKLRSRYFYNKHVAAEHPKTKPLL